jgi:hypothetical protein
MRRLLVVLIVVALGAPAGARASTHLWLDVRSRQLSPAHLAGWELRLTGASDDNFSEAGAPDHGSFGVTLLLKRPGFQETHGYGDVESDELSFDGTSGRLRIGSIGADLRIEATGMAAPHLADACPGSPMLQVPVRLVGTLSLRTGTRFFATVRTDASSGTVLYNDGPPGACYPTADARPPICGHGRTLFSDPDAPSLVTLRWETPSRYRYASIDFRPAKLPGWGHAIELALRRNPFAGLRASTPPQGPLRGSARFRLTARRQDPAVPSCPGPPVTRARGTLTGRFVAAFHGWGTKTLVLRSALGFVIDE